LAAAVDTLDQVNSQTFGIVLNKTRATSDNYYYYRSEEEDAASVGRRSR